MKLNIAVVLVFLLFVGCGKDGAQGPAGAKGEKGDLGVYVTSNQLINAYNTDLCTQYANEICSFAGGQVVKFSDNTIMILGAYRYFFYNGTTDTDSDTTSITAMVPPTQANFYMKLSTMVARGSGYKSLFLTFARSGSVLKLIADTDGDEIPESSDEQLATLTVSDW
ncbi:MAG: hypothetical protein K2X47_15605 [Bdellovibrionales bacterium]|nr:hypothetical protein [Bdellovibrionales bacterium]